MKKLFQFGAVFAVTLILLAGCATVNKTVNGSRGRFNGTWTVTNVGYEALVGNAVQKVFDQAPPAAFVGSVWVLTNSGNGQYTLSDGTTQSIFWSYYDPGNGVVPMFQFKKIYQGDKAKNVDAGYRLSIGNVDANGMTLKSAVDVGGRTGYVVYTFTKTK